jgi:ribosomal-protein-alanine N-acetyltransferase
VAIAGSSAREPEDLMHTMSRTTSLVLVATEQDHVVGTIVGQIVLDEAEIHDVAVEDRFRRQGRATSLVQAFEEHASRQGALQSFLEVRASNQPARYLYETAGYGVQGQRRGYYSNGEDAIVMNKALVPTP